MGLCLFLTREACPPSKVWPALRPLLAACQASPTNAVCASGVFSVK